MAVVEFLGLFVLVLWHEFGHVIAARWLGVQTEEVILWPLGGLAKVGKTKGWWRQLVVAAGGPTVNAVLLPGLFWLAHVWKVGDVGIWVWSVAWMNLFLLVYNLLPIFPLDGGQILDALLAGGLGTARGKLVGSIVGIMFATPACIVALVALDVVDLAIMVTLIVWNAKAMRWAFTMVGVEKRNGKMEGYVCPDCGNKPVAWPTAKCEACGVLCNFLTDETCWQCGERGSGKVGCNYCGSFVQREAWAMSGS